MKKGNNVFKLSGNLALGGGSDYLNEKNINSMSNIGNQNRGYTKEGYSMSSINNKNKGYEGYSHQHEIYS